MNHARTAFLALSLLSMVSAASAQSAPPAPPPPPTAPARPSDAEIAARLPKARALVELTNPNDLMVAANMRGWEAGIAQVFVVDAAAAGIERQYPGAARAAIDAARPLARDFCQRFVTEVNEHKASLVAERLTPAEIERAAAFFGSATGRRLTQRLLSNADPAELARDTTTRSRESGQVSFSPDKLRQMERDAVRNTMSEMTPDDHVAILRFSQTSAATKYKAVGEEVERFALEKAQHPNADWMRRQSELVNQALLSFVDARKAS